MMLLLEHGADLSALDEETLEQCAQEKLDIAAFLVERGVEVPFGSDDEDSDD